MALDNFSVLYVEDTRLFQKVFRNLFTQHTKEIFSASNGKEGLELYEKHKPDIVVTDINMPIMDGLEMSEKIKQLNRSQTIVLLTELTQSENLKKAIEIGVKSFISKPFKEKEMLKTLFDVAEELQNKNDAKKLKEMEVQTEKTELIQKLLHEIGHHWRQPLSKIMAISSGYAFNKEFNMCKSVEEEIKDMQTITNEVEKISNVLKEIELLDFKSSTSEDIENIIKISDPIYSK